MATEFKRQQQLRGHPTDYAANDIVPLDGEIAVLKDGSRTRLKVGDGNNAFSALPFIGEQDDAARAAAAANSVAVQGLDQRVANVEREAASIPGIASQAAANTQAVNQRQPKLADGQAVGDLIAWDGSAWAPVLVGPTQDAMLRFDAAGGRWVVIPRGAPGAVLTVSPIGAPAWLPSASIQVSTLALTGASIQAAFNAAKPTVAVGELLVVSFDDKAYIYTGPTGSGLSGATAADFTAIGSSIAWATVSDFTTPAGGSAVKAISPASLLAWIPNAAFDAGTF
jgi:hypothetical protein